MSSLKSFKKQLRKDIEVVVYLNTLTQTIIDECNEETPNLKKIFILLGCMRDAGMKDQGHLREDLEAVESINLYTELIINEGGAETPDMKKTFTLFKLIKHFGIDFNVVSYDKNFKNYKRGVLDKIIEEAGFKWNC